MSSAAAAATSAFDFSVTMAPAHGGATVSTKELLGGKVALLVNVASQCGLTPQYKGLEELHQKYKDRGLLVLGFPSNEFGGQEPGSDEQINEFVCSRFKATFPLTTKVRAARTLHSHVARTRRARCPHAASTLFACTVKSNATHPPSRPGRG
jgi:glutathione peroxidase-family protein